MFPAGALQHHAAAPAEQGLEVQRTQRQGQLEGRLPLRHLQGEKRHTCIPAMVLSHSAPASGRPFRYSPNTFIPPGGALRHPGSHWPRMPAGGGGRGRLWGPGAFGGPGGQEPDQPPQQNCGGAQSKASRPDSSVATYADSSFVPVQRRVKFTGGRTGPFFCQGFLVHPPRLIAGGVDGIRSACSSSSASEISTVCPLLREEFTFFDRKGPPEGIVDMGLAHAAHIIPLT